MDARDENDPAEDDDTTQIQNFSFEGECKYNLDKQYAHWRKNIWEQPPICIPEAWDVIGKCIRTTDEDAADFGRMLNNRKATTIKAQRAEQIVHAAFQTSRVGGILVSDFDMSKLWQKMKETSAKQIIEKMKPFVGNANIQIDALLFHPELGIVVLECKSSNFIGGPKYKSTKIQAEKSVRRLHDLVQVLTNNPCTVNISYVLCFPNADKQCLHSADEQFTILDKTDLTNEASFHEFWKQRITIQRDKNNSRVINLFSEEVNFCRFIAIIYGFRATHFISSASNAMEIHRMISTMECNQHSNRHNKFCMNTSTQRSSVESYRIPPPRKFNDADVTSQHSLGNCKETTIFLNGEQLSAYERAKQSGKVIIFGPPGSGKTLLIMLLAKEAAEMAKPGQVLVIVPSNSLAKKYQQFFWNNKTQQKRTIVINPRIGDIRKAAEVASDDDVFADEEFTGTWIPRSRPQSRGAMVAAVTMGRYCDPVSAERAKVLLKNRLHTNHYEFIQLKTVMRNTKNICNYYNKFQSPPESIVIGHNINGKCVEEVSVDNIDKACQFIKNRIHQLLTVPLHGTTRMTPRDIAVIVAHEPVLNQLERIKKFLKNDIPNGSVMKQIEGCTDLVAVDSSTNILSLEWCFVFVIDASNCYYSEMLTNPIVPYSRAISCLVAISTVKCKQFGPFWGCGKLGSVMLRSMTTPNYIASSAGRDTNLLGSWSPIAGRFHLAFLAITILLLLIVPEIGIFFLSGPASSQEASFRIVGSVLFVIDSLLIFASQNNTKYLHKPAHKFWAVRVLTLASTIIGVGYIGWAYNWVYSLFLIFPSLFCHMFFRSHAFGLAALEHPRSSAGVSTFTMCYVIYVIIPMLFTIVSAFFIGTGTFVLVLSFYIPIWFHIITFICAGETLNYLDVIVPPKSVSKAIQELRNFLIKPTSLQDRASVDYIRYVAKLIEITKDCHDNNKDNDKVDRENDDETDGVDNDNLENRPGDDINDVAIATMPSKNHQPKNKKANFLFIRYLPPSREWLRDAAQVLDVSIDIEAILKRNGPARSFPHGKVPCEIENVLGDGSCLFRSLSVAIFASPEHHWALRTAITNFVEKDENKRFSDFLHDSVVDYLDRSRMREDGAIGTDVEILAAASLLKCNVLVSDQNVKKQKNRRWKCYNVAMKMGDSIPDIPCLLISYTCGHPRELCFTRL